MYLTNENLTFVKKNESNFVSLKYLNSHGELAQLDTYARNILADSNNHGSEISKNLCLLPIHGKGFPDPFRALPTTSFLCVNIAGGLNIRKYANKLVYDFPANMVATFEAEFTFWVRDEGKDENCRVDPFDTFSNMRSDILETLEAINVKTTIHRSGNAHGECVVGFRGSDIVDLADNFLLTKFVINNVAANYGQKVDFTKNNAHNFKLILLCNNNDGKRFFDYFVANEQLILEYNQFLRINDLNAKSVIRRKLFNGDCKLEIKLNIGDKFVPYIDFAFIVLYFSESDNILQRLEEVEFGQFMAEYKKRMKG